PPQGSAPSLDSTHKSYDRSPFMSLYAVMGTFAAASQAYLMHRALDLLRQAAQRCKANLACVAHMTLGQVLGPLAVARPNRAEQLATLLYSFLTASPHMENVVAAHPQTVLQRLQYAAQHDVSRRLGDQHLEIHVVIG